MMDGISAMDTGNNGQMLNMNVDSIGEVKILTQGYQAEYGRSSGLQITAVTKSVRTGSEGPATTFRRTRTGREQLGQSEERRSEAKTSTKTLATRSAAQWASPAANKLFFFYSHEYRRYYGINNGNRSGFGCPRTRAPATSRRRATTPARCST